ncbi:MAG: ATP synthase subunit I [Halothiobacillus sp.]|jgi:ATP synthase protein I|nr:ATP synthase subunit I [Halothiobacillus sp.]
MTIMSDGIARRGRRVLAAQGIATALLVGTLFITQGAHAALGGFGGAVISLILMLMLRLTMQRAADLAVESPSASMNIMYFGAASRFVMLLVLFGLALGWLKLPALYTVGGFVGLMIVGLLATQGSDSGRPASKTDLTLD